MSAGSPDNMDHFGSSPPKVQLLVVVRNSNGDKMTYEVPLNAINLTSHSFVEPPESSEPTIPPRTLFDGATHKRWIGPPPPKLPKKRKREDEDDNNKQ